MYYPVKNFEDTDGGAPTLNRTVPGSLIALLKAVLIDGFNLQPVASLELAASGEGGRANFVGNHGFRVHQIVAIAGAIAPAWNGEHRVTAVGGQWIEFELQGQPAPESGSGIEIKAAPVGGWEMPLISQDETRAAFRSLDPSGTRAFWYIDDRRSANIEQSPATTTNVDWRFVRGAMDMPDIDTRVDEFGEGFLFVGTSSQGNTIPWDIFADDRLLYLVTHPIDSSGTYRTVHALGDFITGVPGDIHNAMLVLGRYGSTNTTNGSNGSYWGEMHTSSGKTIAADLDTVPTPVNFVMRGSSISSTIGGGGFRYPNAANSELFICTDILIDHTGPRTDERVLRGRVPGIAQPLHPAPFGHREVIRVAARHWKAVRHADTAASSPSAAETLFDVTGPWR